MSLGARATKGGAKGGKDKQQDKVKATDKQTPKEKVKPQATTEQLRMANMIDRKSEDMCDVRRMVTELMEMTRRTEDEVCSALHDSDNDMVAACNLLLEESQRIQGEWQTSEKKKKKPPQPAGNGEVDPPRDQRDPRSRSGPRPRRGEAEGGRGRGAPRGRGGARGGRGGVGRGGRRGGGAARPRPARTDSDWNDPDHADSNNIGDSFPATEDWDNEEWSGSLSDTKVFTPSTAVSSTEPPAPPQAPVTEDWDEPQSNGPTVGAGVGNAAGGVGVGNAVTGEHIPTYTYHNPQHHAPPHHGMREQMTNATPSHGATAPAAPELAAAPYRAGPHGPHHHQPMGMSGSLSAAQSQYLSQLTQQTQRHDANVYTTNYGVYGATDMANQQRKPQRARVPPPSKIPSSAVEMPGDSGGGVFLDVQFGALEPDALHSPPPPHPVPHQPQPPPHQQSQQSHQPHPHQSLPPHQPHHPHQPHQTHQQHPHQPHQSHQPHQLSQATHAPATTTAAPVVQPASTPQPPKQVPSQPEPQPVSTTHEAPSEPPTSTYPNANSMLSESMSVVDSTPTSQPATTESAVTNSTSLDKLSASMKQLGISGVSSVSSVTSASLAATGVATSAGAPPPAAAPSAAAEPPPAPHIAHHYAHHRPKGSGTAQSVYAAHHAVTHHPPVYGANLYAPQVNSTNASLAGASAMTAPAYPSSVTLTQYQPMINSYQQQTSSSAGVYAGNALYTAAPYAPYQPSPQPAKQPTKETAQYESSVASSNSLTSTSTTQTSTSKVTTTTVTGTAAGGAAGAGAGGAAAAGGYAGGALYGGAYAYDETQIMRHHMGGYYEVQGYSGRDGAFGLGAGERFGRTDAASPQQVPAALPPGYAYFYQAPPTTYQYGVYPTYGAGGNVGGVGGVGGVGVTAGGKVSAYSQQQPAYDAQDSYKPGGPYNANASKAGGGAAELGSAMYAKTHVALNKVNSYEKAGFHSGTPPPFGAGSHMYIAAPPHHHAHHHAPQQHQMDVRVNSSHNRRESGAGGARSSAAKPPANKPAYSQSYWTPN